MLKPISTRLLRPIMRGQYLGQALCCLVCDAKVRVEAGQAVGWYRDYAPNLSAPDAAEFICPSCAMLEDLDPDWPDNQTMLAHVPVRRKMPFRVESSLLELFDDLTYADKAGQTPAGKLWVSLPVNAGFPLYGSVEPTPALKGLIAQMIYGDRPGACLDKHYYLDIIWRGETEALVMIKYQQILGQRYVAIVPRQLVIDFFQPAKPL